MSSLFILKSAPGAIAPMSRHSHDYNLPKAAPNVYWAKLEHAASRSIRKDRSILGPMDRYSDKVHVKGK